MADGRRPADMTPGPERQPRQWPGPERQPRRWPGAPQVRDDSIQHRRRGEGFVRDCDKHETPVPSWDYKRKTPPKRPAEATPAAEKERRTVLEVLFRAKKQVVVEEVLAGVADGPR